ncbi:MAG: alpha/beta hydrolase [Burkholderiaceae bacterium]
MPYAPADGARIYYEDTGTGAPVIFVHEFGADFRTWEAQVRALSRQFRCITFNARGYPPSDVPTDPVQYGHEQAAADIGAVLDHLAIGRAHVVGLSMGAYASLVFALRAPARVSALVLAGIGSGSASADRDGFAAGANALAAVFLEQGAAAAARGIGVGATRVQLQNKDPRGWDEFVRYLGEHSPLGSALTLQRYQAMRPTLYAFEAPLRALSLPALVICGDEDDPCLEPSLFLKRTLPNAGLLVMPRSGHGVNLEEPAMFNQALLDFFGLAERGAARERDARAHGPALAAAGSRP